MNTTLTGTRRKFRKFFWTHGHARNIPKGEAIEKPIPRMLTAVIATSWWAQHESWQPNTNIPGAIETAVDVISYRYWLEYLTPIDEHGKPTMRHSVALKLTRNTTYEMLRAFKEVGGRTVKIYPDGVTSHSEDGWVSLKELYPQIGWALELGLIVCLHGEQPGDGIDTYDRDRVFLERTFKPLVADFPGGRFNLEHIPTKRTLETVGEMPANITGGLTIHHQILTRNDVLEYHHPKKKRTGFAPNHVCRPPVFRFEDRDAILHAALHADESAYQKFHLGPDSAPWMEGDKICDCGCNGVFSAPSAGPVVVEQFEKHNRLDHPAFDAFAVLNGARAHGMEPDMEVFFELEKSPWEVPALYGGVAPFRAGHTISWKPVEAAALNPYLLEDHWRSLS